MNPSQSEVLVIGAGPAGAAAATVLARAGVDVVVVDRARFPRDKICGDALSNGAMDRVDELGAGEAVRTGPHAIVTRGEAVFPDGHRLGRDYGRPGYIVPRLALDAALVDAAAAAGAEIRQGLGVRGLRTEGGTVVGAHGPQFEHRARIVIAADGHGSLGLAPLGRQRPRGKYLGVAATAYMRGITMPHGPGVADHYFERELECGYGWIFPAVEGVANMGVYQRSDGYKRGGLALREALDDFIARHPERFAGAEIVGKVRSWPLPLGPVPGAAAGSGLMLVGDAGGFIDPLSGEGIWQALFTGMAAGRIAAQALTQGGLAPEHCARYDAECERHVGSASRGKARAQEAMRLIVGSGIYRLPPVRAALGWAYRRRSFEVTKA
ncbi:MAG: geranylgeranyl reductase family protein [Myxococcales bacterium]|nr:geranylgeranyl reductase family protein [Myxococcales bacterium]